MAIALFILYESIDRFVDIVEISNPLLIVYIGFGGIIINIIGLVMFSGNATLHGHVC
jgi:zinc transporter 1